MPGILHACTQAQVPIRFADSLCLLQTAEAEEPEEDKDDVTFTDQDIGQPEAVSHAQPPQNPPLPTSLPPMPGAPPRPMQFPGAYPPQPAMQVPPLPAARSHDALVQDFKDLLLESKVCEHLDNLVHLNLPVHHSLLTYASSNQQELLQILVTV